MTDDDMIFDADAGMSFDEFMSRPVLISTDAESVARAVRYLEWWLPVGRAGIGSATEDSINTLMQFAREQAASEETA
jgi:hypothetical protein